MSGWGVIEQFLLDGVFVEPGNGAQPAGDGGPGAAAGFQVAGEALDVGAARLEQAQLMLGAPARVLAQVQRVGLAGQAGVTGQEPSQGEPLGLGEHRLDSGDSGWTWTWWPWGTSRVGLRPGEAGPAMAPATMLHLTVRPAG